MQKKRVKLAIRRGDQVKVIAGNYKNEVGVVQRVFPERNRAIVEGVAMVTKHRKPSAQNPQGTIVKQEAPIHISNLMLLAPETDTPTRVGRKQDEDGKLKRYAKKTGKFLNDVQS